MKLASNKSLSAASAAFAAFTLFAAAVVFVSASTILPSGNQEISSREKAQVEKTARQTLAGLPLAFEANRGQTDSRVDFLTRGQGYVAFLSATEAVFKLAGSEESAPAYRMSLIGATPQAAGSASDRLGAKVNYFSGEKAVRGLPTYGKVSYRGVYPGIDLAYYGAGQKLEYDFVVSPGADPGAIKLGFEGVDGLSVGKNGNLAINLGDRKFTQRKPVIYQVEDGARKSVPGKFVVDGTTVGFKIGAYDRSLPLVIDPVISYRTYLGGGGVDIGFGITVDSAGAAYVTGSTSSTNYPTVGALAGDQPMGDGFVTKLVPGGSAVAWSTYLGGSFDDQGWDVGVDASGNVYTAGSTESANFPTTAGAFDTTCGTDGACNPLAPGAQGLADSFLAKLSADGSTLLYSTYLGGSDIDLDTNPAAGALGDMDVAVRGAVAYMTAATGSKDFPTTALGDNQCGTAGAVLGCNLHNDAYLSLIDTSKTGASSLLFSTYLGGDGDDQGKGVSFDSDGNAYVAGVTFGFPQNPLDPTSPPTNNFPSVSTAGVRIGANVKLNGPSGLQPSYGGGASDGFIAKFATSGIVADAAVKLNNLGASASAGLGSLAYASYLGGGGADEAWDVDVKDKNAYVVGYTESGDDPATPAVDGPAPYFPVTPGAYDTSYNGRPYAADGSTAFLAGDAFVAKVKSAGDGLDYATFFGGDSGDVGMGIDVDSTGAAYITGYTHCETPVQHIGPVISSIQIGFPTSNGTSRTGSALDAIYPVHARTTASSVTTSTPDDLPAGSLVTFTATADPVTGANVLFTNDGGLTYSSTTTVAVDGLGQASTAVRPDPMSPVNPATGGLARIRAELVSDPSVYAIGLALWGFPKPQCTSTFPTTPGAPQPTIVSDWLGPELHNSPAEGFVAKLNPTGSGVDYSTFLGGNDFDRGYAIAVREVPGGNEAYVTGRTGSTLVGTAGSAFPNKPAGKGNRDSYVAKITEP